MTHTQQYIQALTGSVDTIMDWRVINDRDKGESARNLRGTYNELSDMLHGYNSAGYGIFCAINELDGQGHTLESVRACRAHVVDLDGFDAAQQFERASSSGASFAVSSSTGKYHVYWAVEPYQGNDRYTLVQRKLARVFNGDKQVIDTTRVMRVPGFYHMKGEPYMVEYVPCSGARFVVESLEQWLQGVNVIDVVGGMRSPLGTPELAAPSLEWLNVALGMVNPNDLAREDWLSLTAAYKQAGWSHADDDTLRSHWLEWCALYGDNNEAENIKLWNSIRDTECGWASFERRTMVKAYIDFGNTPPIHVDKNILKNQAGNTGDNQGVSLDSELLDSVQCAEWFKGCYWVERMGEIFTPGGRFMNATQFNGTYGGKHFIITQAGKSTDEAWKAALRSTLWTVPRVDHVRFLPEVEPGEIVIDHMGRRGLNTYLPANIDARAGDVTPWLDWLGRLLPDAGDRDILLRYLAHCVKFPGFKIPWSPMVQSTEGTGKTVFRELLAHCLGDMYVYQPKAPELVKSGSTFNGWMRAKLMIVVDEIKIDERRELIEILKPMIADARVEIQSKGVDQEMEDNCANWLFFSNYKDAIPVNTNGRRYSIFYSALQSAADVEAAGMGGDYFGRLFDWLRTDGYAAVAHYLLNYPIERGDIVMRAPITSSYDEALAVSRSPMEQIIHDCVTDGVAGFRGGFVSSIAVAQRCRAAGMRRTPSAASIQTCLEGLGYHHVGRADRAYIQEDVNNRAELFALDAGSNISVYGSLQGYA